MKTHAKTILAGAAAIGAALAFNAPAQADTGFSLSVGNRNGGFSIGTGPYCGRWGCPQGYSAYSVYDGPVYFNGAWVYGPRYYRMRYGHPYYWIHGGWHRAYRRRGWHHAYWRDHDRYHHEYRHHEYRHHEYRHHRDHEHRHHGDRHHDRHEHHDHHGH